MRNVFLPLAAAGLVGCSNGPIEAPLDAFVTVDPSSITVGWSESYNGYQDGIGALVWFDVYVARNTASAEMPLERIEVEVNSNYSGAYILPPEAVKLVDSPEVPSEIATPADFEDACTDEDGNFDNSNEWCTWNYDTESGQFYQFGTDYADADGYAPTYMIGQTGDRGLLRVYTYIDAFPVSSTGSNDDISGFQLVVSIGVDSETIEISPI